jgi:O-antigen/teichoic acid export membrane protein
MPFPLPSPRKRRLGVLFFDQAVVSGSGFLMMLLLVREIGLEGYGAFGIVWTLSLFILGMQQAFVSQPMMSIGPKQEAGERSCFYGAVLVSQGVFTLLAALGTVVCYLVLQSIWADPALDGTLLAGTLLILGRQAFGFTRSYFFATGKVRRAFFNDLLAHPGQLAAILFLQLSGNLTLDAALWTLGSISGAMALLGLLQFETVRFTRDAIVSFAARSWKMSRWLGATSVSQWLSANAFLVAAGAILGSGAVGALKAAHNVVGVLHIVFVALENFVPVEAARALARDGFSGMRRYLGRVLKIGAVCTVVSALFLALLARPLLEFLYDGAMDARMVEALRWLTALYVLGFALTIVNIAFRTVERTRALAVGNILVSLPALALAAPLVGSFGFTAVLIGMVVQKALLVVYLGVAFLHLARRRPRPTESTGVSRPSLDAA